MVIQMGCLEPLWGRLTAGPQQPALRARSLGNASKGHAGRAVGAMAGGKERTTPPTPGGLSWAPRRAAHSAPLGQLMSCWPKDVARVGRRQSVARGPRRGPAKGAAAPWPDSRRFIKPGPYPREHRAKGRRADERGRGGDPQGGRECPGECRVTPDTESAERCPETSRPGEARAEVTSGEAAPGQPNRSRWVSGHLGTGQRLQGTWAGQNLFCKMGHTTDCRCFEGSEAGER